VVPEAMPDGRDSWAQRSLRIYSGFILVGRRADRASCADLVMGSLAPAGPAGSTTALGVRRPSPSGRQTGFSSRTTLPFRASNLSVATNAVKAPGADQVAERRSGPPAEQTRRQRNGGWNEIRDPCQLVRGESVSKSSVTAWRRAVPSKRRGEKPDVAIHAHAPCRSDLD